MGLKRLIFVCAFLVIALFFFFVNTKEFTFEDFYFDTYVSGKIYSRNPIKAKNAIKRIKDEFERIAAYEYELGLNYSPHYTNKELKQMTDREEARIVMDWLMDEYEKIENPSRLDKVGIQKAEAIIEEWD